MWPLPYRVSRICYIPFYPNPYGTFDFHMREADLGHFDRQGLQQQQQDWRALELVSQEMKGDRELCMAAVAQCGSALFMR